MSKQLSNPPPCTDEPANESGVVSAPQNTEYETRFSSTRVWLFASGHVEGCMLGLIKDDGDVVLGVDELLDDVVLVEEDNGPVYDRLVAPEVLAPMPSGIVFDEPTGLTDDKIADEDMVETGTFSGI